MKAFVTGASGFIGERVVFFLLERKEFSQINILVRNSKDKAIEEFAKNPKCKIYIGSLKDSHIIQEATQGVEYIIHIAALSSDWGKYKDFFEANITGVRNIIDAANNTKHTLKRFVHISTVDVYGYPEKSHSHYEENPLKDTGLPYNKSKVQGEKLVHKAMENGLPVTIIRPCNVYGPKGKDFTKEVATLLKEGSFLFTNGGKSSAGLVYVDNVAHAIIEAALSNNTIGKMYNISDDSGDITWKEYAYRLADGFEYKYAN